MLLLVICGFAVMMETAASNTVLQTIVDDDKRGRVMSFYAMAFLGVAPLGSLLAGSLASRPWRTPCRTTYRNDVRCCLSRLRLSSACHP